ncbi:fumarylacetoacetate hydrolase family protein [soil metagenome]
MIRNIWAVGRNYAAHAKELGNTVPAKPMIFLKAGSSATLLRDIPLWSGSKDIHHELEIALRFGNVPDANGKLQFDGAAVGLDLTARDIQTDLKANSYPWTLSKSFRHSCPISAMVAIPAKVPHFKFELIVNGDVRQKGDTHDMIFDFEALRNYVFDNFPVEPGDLLLTGTPEGVAALNPGDKASASFQSDGGHEVRMEWDFR